MQLPKLQVARCQPRLKRATLLGEAYLDVGLQPAWAELPQIQIRTYLPSAEHAVHLQPLQTVTAQLRVSNPQPSPHAGLAEAALEPGLASKLTVEADQIGSD